MQRRGRGRSRGTIEEQLCATTRTRSRPPDNASAKRDVLADQLRTQRHSFDAQPHDRAGLEAIIRAYLPNTATSTPTAARQPRCSTTEHDRAAKGPEVERLLPARRPIARSARL